MKSRIESARARPDGPVVRAAQSMVMDIYMVFGVLWEVGRRSGGFGFGGLQKYGLYLRETISGNCHSPLDDIFLPSCPFDYSILSLATCLYLIINVHTRLLLS